jgi:hypothetical protein
MRAFSKRAVYFLSTGGAAFPGISFGAGSFSLTSAPGPALLGAGPPPATLGLGAGGAFSVGMTTFGLLSQPVTTPSNGSMRRALQVRHSMVFPQKVQLIVNHRN